MNVFLDAAKKLCGFSDIGRLSGKEAVNVVGLNAPAKAHFAAMLCKEFGRQGIFITDSDYTAKK